MIGRQGSSPARPTAATTTHLLVGGTDQTVALRGLTWRLVLGRSVGDLGGRPLRQISPSTTSRPLSPTSAPGRVLRDSRTLTHR